MATKVTELTDASALTGTDEFLLLSQGGNSRRMAASTYKQRWTYSTSEQDTGDKWIDGKTVYTKVVVIDPSPGTAGQHTTAHGISNLELVIHCDYSIKATSGVVGHVSLVMIDNAGNHSIGWGLRVSYDATNIIVTVSANWSGSKLYLILYYIKSS